MKLLILLLSVFSACYVEVVDAAVKRALSLNETEVRDGILSGGIWFIEFYAPWYVNKTLRLLYYSYLYLYEFLFIIKLFHF